MSMVSEGDLRAAVNRVRQVEDNIRGFVTCPISNVYQPDPAVRSTHNWAADKAAIVDAYLAEHPADEAEPVNEEWLSQTFGPHLASCQWKRYALHFVTDNFCRTWGWCPPCGNFPPCVCMNEIVILDNPTRGQILKLCAAMGMLPLKISKVPQTSSEEKP